MLVFILLLLVLALTYCWISYKKLEKTLLQRPETYPNVSKKRTSAKKVMVLAGDSITQGNVSYDWVADIEAEFGQYQFFNAGINADLSYTLLNRINDIIAVEPQYVNILIGTNDVNAVLVPKHHYYRLGKIPAGLMPNSNDYEVNLRTIIQALKTKTSAYISMMSLPIITEDLNSKANLLADEYSEIIKKVAQSENITYLALREKQKAFLLEKNQKTKLIYEKTDTYLRLAALKYYILKKDWDEITTQNGNLLTFDNLHLNSVGAGMIGNLVRKTLADVPESPKIDIP